MNSDMEELVSQNNKDRPNTAPTGRDRKNMTFKANLLLQVRLSKISLFCTKVRKCLCRSPLAEAGFLSSVIYQEP